MVGDLKWRSSRQAGGAECFFSPPAAFHSHSPFLTGLFSLCTSTRPEVVLSGREAGYKRDFGEGDLEGKKSSLLCFKSSLVDCT